MHTNTHFNLLRRYFYKLKSLPSRINSSIRRRRLEKRIRSEDDRFRIDKPMKDSSWPVVLAAMILLVVGLLIALGGALASGSFPDSLMNDFYANVATELISIAITVLIIDHLNSWRINKLEKERILSQLSSRSNDFALDAVRIAYDYGWLSDGSLFNYDLKYANLKGARLGNAYLRSVSLFGANLENADLSHAYLKRAFMEGANLMNADLSGSNLKETVLLGANLRNANLWLANLENAGLLGANLEGAVLLQANLKGARLDRARIKNAVYDQFTIWPDNYDPARNGATFHENDSFGSNPITGGAYVKITGEENNEEGRHRRPWE